MNDDEDKWMNAAQALIARAVQNLPELDPEPGSKIELEWEPGPDPKPLADLLRGNSLVPPGIRDLLAELLDPEGAGYLHFKLKLVSRETTRSNFEADLNNLDIAVEYGKRCAKGMSRNPTERSTTHFRSIARFWPGCAGNSISY